MDIFTFICCQNCNNVCLKRPKINEKEAGVGSLKKVSLRHQLPDSSMLKQIRQNNVR